MAMRDRDRRFGGSRASALGFVLVTGVFVIVAVTAHPRAAQREASAPRTAAVELDAVVVDSRNQPIRGLRQDDFQIKDDGHAVAVTSFREVSAAGITGEPDARSLVLLLDDTGIGPTGTPVVQNIARMFLSLARPADTVSVVRLTHHDDEVVADRLVAVERIDEYRARSVPYFGRETVEESLQAITRISRQLEPVAHRRKVLVCVGRRNLCDLYLPVPEDSLVWPYWRDAMAATARANVAIYLVDPAGISGGVDLGYGLVDQTGGADFVGSNNFARAVELIWGEAGHYYLLGYTPASRKRELHTIDVKVKRDGARVRVRRERGD
jgi:VWFA-related protein